MIVYFAADHAGFEMKNQLLAFVRDELGHDVVDCGANELNEADDYPEFVQKAAQVVTSDPKNTRAIVLGGSGQGEAIAANRFVDVRAAVYYGGPIEIIKLSREHNDSNVLALGARFISNDEAQEAVRTWLAEPFSNDERHVRRKQLLDHKHALE